MSQDKKIVIIGCGAAGATAAQFARKTDRKAKISIFEKGEYPQYSKCGLPYAISEEIPKIDNLIEYDSDWFKKANIDLFLNSNIEKIDSDKKIVYAKKDDESIEQSYDSLIIATGAKSFIPPIENADVGNVFVVRTLDDAKNISNVLKKGKNATIIGAGLIGLEMADNLYKKGLNVTVVEALDSILANNLDGDMVCFVTKKIPDTVNVLTDHLAVKVESEDSMVSKVVVKNQKDNETKIIDTDILIIASGTRPNVDIAKEIGCKIGSAGGIVVNSKCETNISDVYAVGDCSEYINFVTAKPALVGLGSIAVRQGIAAGTNVAGGNYCLPKGFLNTSTSEFFGVEIASVGPTTKNVGDIFTVVSAKLNGSSLPEYFPGGKPITVKLLVDKYTGMIIAAQAVGDKAAQRINTFACAILGELDVQNLRKLETAYAPPIAPTLDVVTLVCDIVSMKLNRKR